jgi:hypothetical protein
MVYSGTAVGKRRASAWAKDTRILVAAAGVQIMSALQPGIAIATVRGRLLSLDQRSET